MSNEFSKQYPFVFQDFSAQLILFHEAIAESLGINVTDLKIAGILSRKGPLTASQLAKQTRLTGAALTKIIDRLERSGFVERKKDPKDRRAVLIHAIPEAQTKVQQAYESFAVSMKELFSHYRPEQVQLFLEFISKTSQILAEEAVKLKENSYK